MASHRRRSRRAKRLRKPLMRYIISEMRVPLSRPKRWVFNTPGKVNLFKLMPLEISNRPRGPMSAHGIVSRVSPVQTALRNCTRDEGRSFEVGNQVLISSHRKLLSSKAMVVNVAEKSERDFGRDDWEGGASASEPFMTCRKRIRRCQNRGVPFLWDQFGGCPETAQAASGMEAARSPTKLLCGT